MKKFFTIIAGLLVLVSCRENPEVDIQCRLTAEIDLTTMVKGMKGGNNTDYYTQADKDDPVQLNFLIYDASGVLVYESGKKLGNFFEKTSFTTELKTGSYTVVAWACVATDGVKQDWEAEKKESLNTLKLNTNYPAVLHPVLGVSKTTLVLDKSENIIISVPSVGCFYSILFSYPASTNAKSVVCIGDRDSRSFTVNDGSTYIYTAADYAWDFTYNVDTKYTGVYWCYFILPTDLSVAWGSFDAKDAMMNSGVFTIKAEAGIHQTINVNIETGITTVTPNRSPGLFENTSEQVLEIGKIKMEPARISSNKNLRPVQLF